MADLVWFFFSSAGVVSLLFAGALWISSRPRSAAARRFLLAIALFYALASVYGISFGVGRLLVMGLRPFAQSDLPPGRTAIVVLGSGSFTALDWQGNRFSIPDRHAATRVLEAMRVFEMTGAAWIISSGGLADPDDLEEPTGATMRDALVQLGAPADRVIVETTSRNTREESVVVRSLLESLDVDHVVLVTSDTHMRRSLGTFRAAGLTVIPAIARRSPTSMPWGAWLMPSEGGLGEAGSVAHEILGLAYYGVRGWYRF